MHARCIKYSVSRNSSVHFPSSMEKAFDYVLSPGSARSSSRRSSKRFWPVLTVLVLATLYFSIDLSLLSVGHPRPHVRVPLHAAGTLAKCRSLSAKPAPPQGFSSRTQSDRYESGTSSVLIRNASIWTGLDNGKDTVHGDILLENGLIKSVGGANALLIKDDVIEIDAEVSMIEGYLSMIGRRIHS